MDVEEGGTPQHYRVYRIEPAHATTELIQQEVITDPYHNDIPPWMQQKSGAFYYCEQSASAKSPDGKALASCLAPDKVDELRISDAAGRNIAHWKEKGRNIRGFAWSPDSQSLAVLSISSRLEWSFRELLACLAGHSFTHDTVYVDFIEVSSGRVTEYVIWTDVISSFPRILGWS